MRHMLLTIALAVSCILGVQLTASRRLIASQHTLLQAQRQVIAAQQQQLTQALHAQETLLQHHRRPMRLAQQ